MLGRRNKEKTAMADPMGMTILHDGGQTPQVDIIAIHGLNGGSKSTWTDSSGDQAVMWLQDYLPSISPSCRIMTYGFNANILCGSEATIRTLSKSFLEFIHIMRTRENRARRPIIFLAHSLGGLIVKNALIYAKGSTYYSTIYAATYGIIFFGTPHRGSASADIAAILGRITEAVLNNTRSPLVEALKTDSELLHALGDFFAQHRFRVISFFEGLPTSPLKGLVVNEYSATIGLHDDFEKCLQLDLNHRDLCKFSNNTSGGFVLVSNNIEEFVEAAIEKAAAVAVRVAAAESAAGYSLNSRGNTELLPYQGNLLDGVCTLRRNVPTIFPRVPAQVPLQVQANPTKVAPKPTPKPTPNPAPNLVLMPTQKPAPKFVPKPAQKTVVKLPTKKADKLQALKNEKLGLERQCHQLRQALSGVGKRRQSVELQKAAFKAQNRGKPIEQVESGMNMYKKSLHRLENERVELECKRRKATKQIEVIEAALRSKR